MRTPWQVRAWATGASLALNGALVLGVMQMNPGARMAVMEETAMLVSLGDPSLTATDNATSPDAKPAPEPPEDPAEETPPPPSPVEPSVKTRVTPPRPDGYLSAAAPPRPPAPAAPPSEAPPRPTSSAAPAATAIAAKAMNATAARPPAGSANADSIQAHAGSSTSYAARVRAWLESNKTYPKAARMRKQQGVARLVFVIDRAGHVLECRLLTPSGYALLDQEAMAMVARSDPFPTPPHTIKGDRIELDAPVEFSLER
jgi:protein TonB